MTTVGNIVTVSTDPPFSDADGIPTDPTTVTLRWFVHGGSETVWVYGTDAEVVKDGTGDYHADIPVDQKGLYYYRWQGEGAVVAAVEGTFNGDTYFTVAP